MTERIYQTESQLQSLVCRVTACRETEAGFDIELDRSIVFPNAGGQPCDLGTITSVASNVRITGCDEDGERLLHHTDGPLPVGAEVTVAIDWDRRFDLMQQHTGEHLLSWAFYKLFGAANVGFHLNLELATMDLDMPLTREQLLEGERFANRLVWDDRRVTAAVYATAEEAAELPLRKQSEGLTAPIRIVTVDGADMCTCCAPHVATTGRVGSIFIGEAVPWKGGMRLTFFCGDRALSLVRSSFDALTAIARRFSTGRDQALSAVEKAAAELSESRKKEAALSGRLAQYLTEDLKRLALQTGKHSLICAYTEEVSADRLQAVANGLTQDAPRRCVLLLAPAGEGRLGYILQLGAEVKADLRELTEAVNVALSARGGGRGQTARGSGPMPAVPAEAADGLRDYLRRRLA